MYFRRQFLSKMWPIQLSFLLLSYLGYSSSPSLFVTLHLSHDQASWSSPAQHFKTCRPRNYCISLSALQNGVWIPVRPENFFLQRHSGIVFLQCFFVSNEVLSLVKVKLITLFHLLLRWRIHGTVSPRPPYVMSWGLLTSIWKCPSNVIFIACFIWLQLGKSLHWHRILEYSDLLHKMHLGMIK